MSGFDRKLDKQISKETVEVGDAKISVGVYSYNDGDPKVQISRMRRNEKSEYGYSFAKLGRLTRDELINILPLLENALEKM